MNNKESKTSHFKQHPELRIPRNKKIQIILLYTTIKNSFHRKRSQAHLQKGKSKCCVAFFRWMH